MGNFEFKKKFGQNFLSDTSLLTEIVEKANVTSEDIVVEIGAGKGALTEVLSKYAKKVYSFEVDKDLFEYLSSKFEGSNVEFIFEDIMNFSDEKLSKLVGDSFLLVANLPYYITSPIITRFLKNKNMRSLTVMVQEEVADRIIAVPRTKDYGVLSIICQIYGTPEKVLRVGREKFYPIPKVDSAVVKIVRGENYDLNNYEYFVNFVKKCFAMRRKKLSANLENKHLSKIEIEKMLIQKGFSEMTRAEELSISDFKKLFELFYDKLK